MPGTPAVVGVIAVTTALCVGVCAVGAAASASQRAAGAAENAAIAAADSASGRIPGDPCANAERVAAANRVHLRTCQIVGPVATVSVSASVAGLPVAAGARAGPPPEGETNAP